jgi:hypothetical protein
MTERAFVQIRSYNQRELVGARWWHDAIQDTGTSRRSAIKVLGWTVGGIGLLSLMCNYINGGCDGDEDEQEGSRAALDLQRQLGWDVGSTSRELSWEGASPTDADGSSGWIAVSATLDKALAPRRAELRPFYIPTLFQAPGSPANKRLASALRPISTLQMDQDFVRGRALASLFGDEVRDTLLIIDLPGPQAVAFAAGCLPRFDPVFLFDNWPHPLGVVPAHLTLGAALYYCGRFRSAARTPDSLPAFVLDSNRLPVVADVASRFDNRYLVHLPSPERLRALGLTRVFYIRPDQASMRELDDLNESLCACAPAGVEVRGVVLDDFREDDDGPDLDLDIGGGRRMKHRYFGSRRSHASFWRSYGRPGGLSLAGVRSPAGLSYRPSLRTSAFHAGVALGIGHVAVTTGRSSGKVTSLGRSGSLGRFGGRGGS